MGGWVFCNCIPDLLFCQPENFLSTVNQKNLVKNRVFAIGEFSGFLIGFYSIVCICVYFASLSYAIISYS
jgi:hypothetical protein